MPVACGHLDVADWLLLCVLADVGKEGPGVICLRLGLVLVIFGIFVDLLRLCLLFLLRSGFLVSVGQQSEVNEGGEQGQDGVAHAFGANHFAKRDLVKSLKKNGWKCMCDDGGLLHTYIQYILVQSSSPSVGKKKDVLRDCVERLKINEGPKGVTG